MTEMKSCRGYVSSRPIGPDRTAQHVQNIVIRDFANKNNLMFKLSATEYQMPGCHLMLNQVMDELDTIDGVILYSMFMLPEDADKRQKMYSRVLETGSSMHGALENISFTVEADIKLWENIYETKQITSGLDYDEIVNCLVPDSGSTH